MDFLKLRLDKFEHFVDPQEDEDKDLPYMGPYTYSKDNDTYIG